MTLTSSRFWRGAWYGLVATIAMTLVMLVLYAIGLVPEPVYLTLIARMLSVPLGTRELTPTGLVLAVPFHLAYGSFWGGLATITSLELTWWKGLVLGMALWLMLMMFLVPFSGELAFATIYSPTIWISTLLMHVVYGVTFGALAERHEPLEAHATSLG